MSHAERIAEKVAGKCAGTDTARYTAALLGANMAMEWSAERCEERAKVLRLNGVLGAQFEANRIADTIRDGKSTA